MTTKITVDIKGQSELLDKSKALQAKQRQADLQQKEERKDEKIIAEQTKAATQAEEGKWKGAVADKKEKERKSNRSKIQGCGHWMYKDYTYSLQSRYNNWRTDERATFDGPDIVQVSIGSGDGTKWATHYFHGPTGKVSPIPFTLTGTMGFVGYLSSVSWGYTVYTIPSGAIVTPYDPAVYLGGTPPAGACPNGFCWVLYFPDELSSGPGRSRKNITLNKGRASGETTSLFANQNQFCFPVNNQKTVIVIPSWLHWFTRTGVERYSAESPGTYSLHPQNQNQPAVSYKVYYKKPGGVETGWTEIIGYYWLMDPTDDTVIVDIPRLSALMPLAFNYNTYHNGRYEIAAFVVSHNNAKKLETIPPAMEAKVRARCPEPPWPDNETAYLNLGYLIQEINDQAPGYPAEIDEIYNNASWMISPDTHCMGVARNLFIPWQYDGEFLPYDYFGRYDSLDEGHRPDNSPLFSPQVLGVSPGIYDLYDADLQDHALYNHFGKGEWYDSWEFSYSNKDSWTSEYGDLRLHTQDVTLENSTSNSKHAWSWFYNMTTVTQLRDGSTNPLAFYSLTRNDIAWIYLNKAERQSFIDNYTGSYPVPGSFPLTTPEFPAIVDYILSAPDPAEFNYMYYTKDANHLQNGVRLVRGFSGTWVDYNSIIFDYDTDPFYDQPFENPADPHWTKSKNKHKLSENRMWPPSISVGITEPMSASTSLQDKADHPLADGRAYMTLMINTAWDNDYTSKLIEIGFTPEDLAL